jgi:hypothetical protein
MREIRAFIWKEWHETRLFLWIAWGLFIGLPIIGGVEERVLHARRFELYVAPWVILIGPLLAIVVGVAATSRDLKPKLEDFWQSRPMGGLRLFIVKYLVGTMVVVVACGVPLVMELVCNRDSSEAESGLCLSFLWMAVFATAFASGCFFHKPAHAAAVAAVGVLLIYFLPIVFPPLQRFGMGQVLDPFDSIIWGRGFFSNGRLLEFALGMIAVATVMGAMGIAAVRFHWHIESERPLIYGAISVAMLVPAESASYRLGTNLPVLGSFDLPKDRTVVGLSVKGTSGTVTTEHFIPGPSSDVDASEYFSQPFRISNSGLEMGAERALAPDEGFMSSYHRYERSERDPKVVYWVDAEDSETGDDEVDSLCISSDEKRSFSNLAPSIELWRGPRKTTAFGRVCVWHDRLYVFGQRTIAFDVSNPLRPKRISDEPIVWIPHWQALAVDHPVIQLPPGPGLPAADRLKFALDLFNENGFRGAFDGLTWCCSDERTGSGDRSPMGLEAFRLKSLSEDLAEFDIIGKYDPSLVRWITGEEGFGRMQIKNGLLYASQYSCLDVFDLRAERPLRMIAHFSTPGIRYFELLDDGRVVVDSAKVIREGGRWLNFPKIWLLGPPPKH